MSFDPQAAELGLPLYRSHKRVRAAKIVAVASTNPADSAYSLSSSVQVEGGGWLKYNPANKPKPQPGWYVVCYDDGYVSFSPADAFEQGYSPLDPSLSG